MLIIKIIYVWYGETYGSEGLCLVAFCITCIINKYANYMSRYQIYTFIWHLLQLINYHNDQQRYISSGRHCVNFHSPSNDSSINDMQF